MSIKINNINFSHIPGSTSPEREAAQQLKDKIESFISQYPEAQGDIYIFSNISIFGYPVRDIDIVIIGTFHNFQLRHKVYSKTLGEITNLQIDSFICNIELKDHPSDEIYRQATSYHVNYKGKSKDATEQALKQMHSFREFITNTTNLKPWLANLLWFRNLTKPELAQLRKNEKDNALSNDFNFIDLINALLLQYNISKEANAFRLKSFQDDSGNAIRDLITQLSEKRIPKGLTKKKFEAIIQQQIDLKPFTSSIGEKITIMKGRAGTGKTVQLLQLAFYLANPENDNRCLLLTYNHALVCDIRRLIDFSNIPTGIDSRTVSIKTIDSFFQELMITCGIIHKYLDPTDSKYPQQYRQSLNELHKYITEELRSEDFETLKEIDGSNIDWDYILIDEAQDWSDLEKNILFKVYGPQCIIVADGVDQFVRSNHKQNWNKGLGQQYVPYSKELKIEMRQKSNLVRFLNAYSKELQLDWSIKENNNLLGGKIKIYNHYNSNIHINLLKNCKQNECENYDLLILVPPSLVVKDERGTHFSKFELYKEVGIQLFDGTNFNNRTRYPTKDLSRVYQYDSCRGLEGWVVVCQAFDELIKYKTESYTADPNYLGLDQDAAKKKFVYTWSLMPLTRPVDTLVITLNDANSEIGRILYGLSQKFSDIIEWNIN